MGQRMNLRAMAEAARRLSARYAMEYRLNPFIARSRRWAKRLGINLLGLPLPLGLAKWFEAQGNASNCAERPRLCLMSHATFLGGAALPQCGPKIILDPCENCYSSCVLMLTSHYLGEEPC
jgi:hypothetical protein